MEGGKKIVAVIVLLVVIVGAVGLIIKQKASQSGPPSGVMAQQLEMVDVETGELITQPLGKWQSGGMKNGMYMNPTTKKFTVTDPIKCAACGEKIPPPADLPSANPEDSNYNEVLSEIQKMKSEYKCPKCSGAAYRSMAGG